MFSSYIEANSNLNIQNSKVIIQDFKDITVNPDYETYWLENYDLNYDVDSFKEMFFSIFNNNQWDETKLHYLLLGFIEFLKNNTVFEVNNINDFFDLNILKRVTIELIEQQTEQDQKDQLTQYYERFYEIFDNFVGYMRSYLDIIESNEEVENNLKKDLLVFYGQKIYNARGMEEGLRYIEKILNPLTVTNKLTGEVFNFEIGVDLTQWGEFTPSTGIPEEKYPYIYNLIITNANSVGIKQDIISLIRNIIHPAGYKSNIQDFTQFQINLKLNVDMLTFTNKNIATEFFDYTNIYDIKQTTSVSVVDFGGQFGRGYVDYVGNTNYNINSGELTVNMGFDTPELDYS
jgi:hypothetical protein